MLSEEKLFHAVFLPIIFLPSTEVESLPVYESDTHIATLFFLFFPSLFLLTYRLRLGNLF